MWGDLFGWVGGGGGRGFGEGEMLGEIDAEDFVLGFVDADAEAVVEEAELFELLGVLAFAGRQLGNFAKGCGCEGVEADVFVESFVGGGVAVVRDLAAGEIEGVSFVVADDFGDLGIGGVVGIGDFLFEGPEVAVVIGGLEEVADHLLVDERLIALPVHPDVGIDKIFSRSSMRRSVPLAQLSEVMMDLPPKVWMRSAVS